MPIVQYCEGYLWQTSLPEPSTRKHPQIAKYTYSALAERANTQIDCKIFTPTQHDATRRNGPRPSGRGPLWRLASRCVGEQIFCNRFVCSPSPPNRKINILLFVQARLIAALPELMSIDFQLCFLRLSMLLLVFIDLHWFSCIF